MFDAFAVIPDGENLPAAVFTDLEAAIEWALGRYGADAFRIAGRSVYFNEAPAGPRAAAA